MARSENPSKWVNFARQLIRQTIEYFEQHPGLWVKGEYDQGPVATDPKLRYVCTVGAMQLLNRNENTSDEDTNEQTLALANDIAVFAPPSSGGGVEGFNDHDDTKLEDILNFLRKAELAVQQPGWKPTNLEQWDKNQEDEREWRNRKPEFDLDEIPSFAATWNAVDAAEDSAVMIDIDEPLRAMEHFVNTLHDEFNKTEEPS